MLFYTTVIILECYIYTHFVTHYSFYIFILILLYYYNIIFILSCMLFIQYNSSYLHQIIRLIHIYSFIHLNDFK